MVEPIRRSSDASAMMRRSMEDADALGGMTGLVAGDDLGAVQAVRDRLAALGADATALAGDTEAIARAAAADPPAAVIAVGAAEAALRSRLDPFGREAGPPVISLAAVADAEDGVGPLAARRLRALAERAALRARQSELEGVLAGEAVTRGARSRWRGWTRSIACSPRPGTAMTTRTSTRSASDISRPGSRADSGSATATSG